MKNQPQQDQAAEQQFLDFVAKMLARAHQRRHLQRTEAAAGRASRSSVTSPKVSDDFTPKGKRVNQPRKT